MTNQPNQSQPRTTFAAWDSTRIKQLYECELALERKYVHGWRGKGFSAAMIWGQQFHKVCELFGHLSSAGSYVTQTDPYELFMAGVLLIAANAEEPLFSKLDPKDTKRNKETFIRTADAYWHRWWGKEAYTTALVGDTSKPMLELHVDFVYRNIRFVGYIDRVGVTAEGDYYVIDPKTTGSSLAEGSALNFFAKYDMDIQFVLYCQAIVEMFGVEPAGVIIDGIQPLVKESRFSKYVMRIPREKRIKMMDQIVDRIEQYNADVLADRPTPMNLTSCSGMFDCTFKKVCQKIPSTWNDSLKLDFQQEAPWSPDRPRESLLVELGGWDTLEQIVTTQKEQLTDA